MYRGWGLMLGATLRLGSAMSCDPRSEDPAMLQVRTQDAVAGVSFGSTLVQANLVVTFGATSGGRSQTAPPITTGSQQDHRQR